MNAPPLSLEEVSRASLPQIALRLAEAGLPRDGIDAPQCRVWRLGDGTSAVAAVEFYGSYGLLRSVLVDPSERGRGLGRAIVAAVLDEAMQHGVREIYLLTMTAAEFFAALGFRPIERARVPNDIARSGEFTGLCPASAQCMMKSLPD
jgi:amino-acid N-acetyltransferase